MDARRSGITIPVLAGRERQRALFRLARAPGEESMCGIVGAIDLDGARLFRANPMAGMCRAIAQRGPHDQHVHSQPGLAIVDLSGGREPLANENGRVLVAIDGELFDDPDLLRQLTNRGHRLTTRASQCRATQAGVYHEPAGNASWAASPGVSRPVAQSRVGPRCRVFPHRGGRASRRSAYTTVSLARGHGRRRGPDDRHCNPVVAPHVLWRRTGRSASLAEVRRGYSGV